VTLNDSEIFTDTRGLSATAELLVITCLLCLTEPMIYTPPQQYPPQYPPQYSAGLTTAYPPKY